MATTNNHNTDAQAIINSTLQLAPIEVRTLEHEGRTVPFALGRDSNDGSIRSLDLSDLVDGIRVRPFRRQGLSRVNSETSLVKFLQRYKGPHSTLWATLTPRESFLRAIINDHQQGHDGEPEFADFGAHYEMTASKEWIDWTSNANKPMSQSDFAEFIEERLPDLAKDPTSPRVLEVFDRQETEAAPPSTLLQVSRGLRVNVSSEVVTAKNLSSGETEVAFKEEHATSDRSGNRIRVPNAFLLKIPAFDFAPPVEVAGFLRYSVQGGKVSWLYRLFRPHLAREESFMALCQEIATQADVPLFYGTH